MLTTLAQQAAPGMAALLIVDMQNDFCHPEGAGAKNGGDVSHCAAMTARLSELIEAARAAGVPPVFIHEIHNRWDSSPAKQDRVSERKAQVCEEGSWGADWYGVAPEPGDPVITKRRYSAFINTDLDLILRSQGIKTVIVTGVATNVCAESTARDGHMLNYHMVFVDDCAATSRGQAAHDSTLSNMGRYFGTVVRAADLMDVWTSA